MISGERPYPCTRRPNCLSFTTRGRLNQHIRVVHGERPYRCGICDDGFERKIELKNHQNNCSMNMEAQVSDKVVAEHAHVGR